MGRNKQLTAEQEKERAAMADLLNLADMFEKVAHGHGYYDPRTWLPLFDVYMKNRGGSGTAPAAPRALCDGTAGHDPAPLSFVTDRARAMVPAPQVGRNPPAMPADAGQSDLARRDPAGGPRDPGADPDPEEIAEAARQGIEAPDAAEIGTGESPDLSDLFTAGFMVELERQTAEHIEALKASGRYDPAEWEPDPEE